MKVEKRKLRMIGFDKQHNEIDINTVLKLN